MMRRSGLGGGHHVRVGVNIHKNWHNCSLWSICDGTRSNWQKGVIPDKHFRYLANRWILVGEKLFLLHKTKTFHTLRSPPLQSRWLGIALPCTSIWGWCSLKHGNTPCTSAWRHERNWNTFVAGRCQELNAGTLTRTLWENFKSDDMSFHKSDDMNSRSARKSTDCKNGRWSFNKKNRSYPAFQLNGRKNNTWHSLWCASYSSSMSFHTANSFTNASQVCEAEFYHRSRYSIPNQKVTNPRSNVTICRPHIAWHPVESDVVTTFHSGTSKDGIQRPPLQRSVRPISKVGLAITPKPLILCC